MTVSRATRPYEAPHIDERSKIDLPLVLAAVSGNLDAHQ